MHPRIGSGFAERIREKQSVVDPLEPGTWFQMLKPEYAQKVWRLSPARFQIYCALLSHRIRATGLTTVSYGKIAKTLEMRRQNVQRTVGWLRDHGFIKHEGWGKAGKNVFSFPHAADVGENKDAEEQVYSQEDHVDGVAPIKGPSMGLAGVHPPAEVGLPGVHPWASAEYTGGGTEVVQEVKTQEAAVAPRSALDVPKMKAAIERYRAKGQHDVADSLQKKLDRITYDRKPDGAAHSPQDETLGGGPPQ